MLQFNVTTDTLQSCRELKKYISGGRSVVRELEAVILEENPALFREYISAAPDVKILMDNQFKNVKTQSRLLSKEMWYNWRMDLLKELREGLLKTVDGMQVDMEVLQSQQQLIDFVLPGLVST
jgi:kinetochore protein Spc7/SPC105